METKDHKVIKKSIHDNKDPKLPVKVSNVFISSIINQKRNKLNKQDIKTQKKERFRKLTQI
jgi:hypothetical protein